MLHRRWDKSFRLLFAVALDGSAVISRHATPETAEERGEEAEKRDKHKAPPTSHENRLCGVTAFAWLAPPPMLGVW
jgi:hypothetical protein